MLDIKMIFCYFILLIAFIGKPQVGIPDFSTILYSKRYDNIYESFPKTW